MSSTPHNNSSKNLKCLQSLFSELQAILEEQSYSNCSKRFLDSKLPPWLETTSLKKPLRVSAFVYYIFCKTHFPTEYGVTTVTGTNDDLSLITELSSKADIVLNAADADADATVKAALDGQSFMF